MKIAFFTEGQWQGKVSRDHTNMRTEMAWMCTLDADHFNIHNELPSYMGRYDLGIIIIPKNNPQFDLEIIKKWCSKVATMQEGPHWYFQDYTMEEQIWWYNTLTEFDMLFAHNKKDVKYYQGLVNKPVEKMPTLMLTERLGILPRSESGYSVMIGGNMVRWYGGFDSYVVAQEFDMPIYAPSMGRKIDREDEMEINHLPYMTWVEWINTLSQFHSAVHLMPTHAAGTFTLNCAFHGIPCIGYRGLDTQEELHPELTVDDGDLKTAKELANKLKMDKEFYDKCSKTSRDAYRESLYTEEKFIPYIEEIFERLR